MVENRDKPFAISHRLLLLVYGILPVLLLLVVLDQSIWGGLLKEELKITVTNAPLYILFFELPHIIASFVSYADRDYVNFYRHKLFVRLPILVVFVVAMIYVNFAIVFSIYVFYTMYHVLKQQTGVASMLLRRNDIFHKLWTYTAIAATSLSFFYVYSSAIEVGSLSFWPDLTLITAFTLLFVVVSMIYANYLSKKGMGWWYFLATSAMVLVGYLCIYFGYLFFAIFAFRFAHDVTAFIFYAVHDSNRNYDNAKNFIYRFIKPFHLPLIFITPAVGIFIAYILQSQNLVVVHGISLAMVLGFVHYYIEGFAWKRNSLHREQLRFTT